MVWKLIILGGIAWLAGPVIVAAKLRVKGEAWKAVDAIGVLVSWLGGIVVVGGVLFVIFRG